MRTALLLAATLISTTPVMAQAPSLDPAHAAEMKKLDWLAGRWEGEAIIQTGPDQKVTVQQTERIESKAGGTVLMIEGQGTMNGRIVHDAFAVVTWDPAAKKHKVSAYLSDGRAVVADAVAGDGTLEWQFDTPAISMRYLIERTEDGGWKETGFRNRPGEEPVKFIEMALTKVK